jgi:hypothetical protein
MTPSRRAFLRALSFAPLSTARIAATAQPLTLFQRGWNHPWIGYGHDFGRAWGHDGLSTSGWTCDTDPSSLGFTDSEVTVHPQSGRGALRIRTHLVGGDPSRSRGAVTLSLVDHWPFACPSARAGTLDLDGVLVRCRIRLPEASAGSIQAPNTLQLVLKTRLTAESWPSLYTAAVAIEPAWEERDVELSFRLDARGAAYIDPGFDINRVSLIGLAMTVDSRAPARVAGDIWVDHLTLEMVPRVTFEFDRTEIDAQFEYVRRRHGRGFVLVRFFVLCDGRAAPSFAPDGRVERIDPLFFRDFDALVRAAERQGVLLIPVLLDFGWCADRTTVSGVQLGGHAEVIRDPAKRRSFLEHALAPILERYGSHPAILAWDVCNEPEWIIDEIPEAFRRNHEMVSLADMRAFVQGCARYVHRFTSNQLATVGSARRKWVRLWTGCDLDLYQFHWFDHFRGDEPFPWPPCDELDLDKPCLIGEVPTSNTRFSIPEFSAAAEAGGYAGLLFWSYTGRDAFSDLCARRERPAERPPRRNPSL